MVKTILSQVKEYKRVSILTPVCMLGEVIMEMIIPLLMASIIDKGVSAGDIHHIKVTGLIMLFMAAISLTLGILSARFGAQASAGLAKNLRQAMFEKVQTFSFSNLDKFSTSSLITRLTTDVTNVQNAYMMILRMCTRAPATMLIAMVLSFAINGRLASVYLVAVVVLGLLLFLIMSKAMRYFKEVFQKYDDLNASVQENISGIRVVKAYVREPFETNKFHKAAQNIYDRFLSAEKILSWNMPLMNFTVYASILLISWLGANFIVAGSLTTGELMNLLTYCMSILMSLMMLSMIFVMVSMSTASAQRICEVLDEQPDLTNPEHPVFDIPDGSVEFRHVDFAYRKDAEKPVLRDIDLKVTSGETIGIIGGTGSAKSTLVNLIARLYDTTEGAVRVGGVDVRDYDLDALRHQVAMVLQKNVLFSGTIAENLRWGDPNATDEEVREAAHLACADEFVDGFPKGYDTWIEQGGSNVSGGQKQRLCIARALLRRPKILILDDSTSAVDTKTDAKIRAGLASYLPNTTKLIIAQRISSVQDADRIIVMEGGRIAQIGNHEELLKTSEIYRETFTSQNKMSAEGEGAVEADTEASATQAQTQEGGEAHE